MVDFGGWDMPVSYGSQIDEHHAVRRDAGMFDVSHMLAIDLKGVGARDFLRYAFANNVDKLAVPGKALYSCLLRSDGGVLDDLIVYFLREDAFRVVVNAATAEKDLAWLSSLLADRAPGVALVPRRDLAMIAVQGPHARERVWKVLPQARTHRLVDLADGRRLPQKLRWPARAYADGRHHMRLMREDRDSAQLQLRLQELGQGAEDLLRLTSALNRL